MLLFLVLWTVTFCESLAIGRLLFRCDCIVSYDWLMMTLERRHNLIRLIIQFFCLHDSVLPKLIFKSNRLHFLWVYWRDNPFGMLKEHAKSLYITRLWLGEVFNSIVSNLYQDIQTGIVYLDLYKAFDSVCHARFQ